MMEVDHVGLPCFFMVGRLNEYDIVRSHGR